MKCAKFGRALHGMTFSGDTVNITVNINFPGPPDEYLVTGTSSLNSAEIRMVHLTPRRGAELVTKIFHHW
jgi:hypothetical protein